MSKIINVGRVTAYAEAVAGGYTGTLEEWERDLANLGTTAAEVEANRQEVADNTQAVADDKAAVEEYKDAATQSAAAAAQSAADAHTDALAATAAKEAAQTAQGSAVEAKEAAVSAKNLSENAQTEADQSARAAAGSALVAGNAAQTATAQAGAASDSATAAAASAAAAAESARTLTIDTTLTQEGQAADAKKVGDEVAELKAENYKLSTFEIKLPRCMFVLGSGYSESGAEQSWSYSVRTIGAITINEPCIIKSANENIMFYLKSNVDNKNLYEDGFFELSLTPLDAKIEIHTVDNSAFRAEYIDDISIYTTKQGYEYFEENYTIHVKNTIKFTNLGVSYNKYAIGTGENNFGLLIRGNVDKRVIARPIVCDRNATILAGQYGTVTVNIIVGNQLAATLHNGDTYTVPANTPFSVGFATSESASDQMANVNYIIISESYPEYSTYQKLTARQSRRADGAFITDDNKIFMIGYGSGGSYTVKQGNTFIKARTTMDHDPGHANSCNYNNGKAYVSDWTDPTLIHVYAVDTSENALTYEKDIVIPHPEDRESIEYYVTDNEKQIFFMGWNVDRETMCYGLYVQTASGYALAWERKSLRIALLQGFTMQDRYMYLVENTDDGNYKFLGLVRLDLATGIMQRSQTAPDGSAASMEIEAAIPIGKETFILVGVDGTTYMHEFVAEETVV